MEGQAGEIDASRLRILLLSAVCLFGAFQIASLLDPNILFAVDVGSLHRASVVPWQLLGLDLAPTAIAMFALIITRPGRGWRTWILIYWLTVIGTRTAITIAADKDEPLLMALFVIVLASATIMPWSVKWQSLVGFASLAAFTVASMIGIIESTDVQRWIILAAVMAFGQSFCALRNTLTRQRQLADALRESEAGLRAENAERREVEIQLRQEVLEREERERSASDDQAALRRVFDASLDTIAIYELATGRFIYVNKEFTKVGYSRDEAIGKTAAELKLFSKRATYLTLDERLRIRGQIRNLEVGLRRADGTIVASLISAAAVELWGKQCAVAIVRDIADRKKIEIDLIAAREAALEASKAKSEFLSSMSHEIRTPMNAVLGMAELLADTELSAEQRRYLEVMVANGNSLLELINSVLDLAKIESGRMQIEKTEFDLAELIDQTVSTFGVRAHGKGLELVARIAPGVPNFLVGDPLRLRQVLVNLVGNAIKFTEIGQIVIEVRIEPGAEQTGLLRFSVSDSGIGISADKLDSIFQKFTQADSSVTRKFGGSGLGLAIAQRLVGLMGGRIWVESAVGRGSVFSFTAQLGLASRVITPEADVVLTLAGYRVLVVDDIQINRLIVGEMISGCGAEVSEASSGVEALTAIRTASNLGKPFGIVLLDMRMPEMDGLETARRIQAEHLPIEPIILMLSSDDLKVQVDRLRELGLDAYLIKPVSRKELFEAIRRILVKANRTTPRALPERPSSTVEPARATDTDGVVEDRILVVDDSPDNRMLVGAYLRRQPYKLDYATNGLEAVAAFAEKSYALVLMDIQMPEMDGLTATREIRALEEKQGCVPTPILALTASALEEDVKRCLAAGCTAHLAKPIKKGLLLDTINTFRVRHPSAGPAQSTAPSAMATS